MKFGIALAGGGARGAYQVGAWQALLETNTFDLFSVYSGASVGSINASLFAMGNFDLAKETWLSLEKDSLFHVESNLFKRLVHEKMNFFNKGIYDTTKLESMMEDTIDYDLLRQKDVYVATTYLGDNRDKFYDLIKTNYDHYLKNNENLIHYRNLKELNDNEIKLTILASCAIPIAFKPVTIDGKTFYDGGMLDNVPIAPLKEAGCDRILVIDLFRMNYKKYLEMPDPNIRYLNPKHDLYGILDFEPALIRRRFELGYNDMMRFIEENSDFFEEK
jgi:NTE family protein